MRGLLAGILGGALAGMGMTAVVLAERQFRRDSDGGSDGLRSARPALAAPEQSARYLDNAGHFAASAGFGATYVLLRRWVPGLPSAGIGTAYGAGVAAIDLAGTAPIAPTDGARNPGSQVAGRIALHLLFGAGTALAMAMLTDREAAD